MVYSVKYIHYSKAFSVIYQLCFIRLFVETPWTFPANIQVFHRRQKHQIFNGRKIPTRTQAYNFFLERVPLNGISSWHFSHLSHVHLSIAWSRCSQVKLSYELCAFKGTQSQLESSQEAVLLNWGLCGVGKKMYQGIKQPDLNKFNRFRLHKGSRVSVSYDAES